MSHDFTQSNVDSCGRCGMSGLEILQSPDPTHCPVPETVPLKSALLRLSHEGDPTPGKWAFFDTDPHARVHL
jgi:hypothetical protein